MKALIVYRIRESAPVNAELTGCGGRGSRAAQITYSKVRMCSTRVWAVTGPCGSLSPAGSSSASLTVTALTSQSSTTITKRLQRGPPSTDIGPGCLRTMPTFRVSLSLGSPMNVMKDSAMPWSFAQPFITAASLTQYTMISATPFSFSSDARDRYSGTCTEDQHGVKAPGRPMMITFFSFKRSSMLIFSGGKPKSSSTSGNLDPTAMTFCGFGAFFVFALGFAFAFTFALAFGAAVGLRFSQYAVISPFL
mmetsp:Transcript_148056/g.258251  ORF Transcript_148056/g.258251 Transcript_148056/m.258251 type:complete len:250 (+) Transcript_148056:225-974(+)